MKVVINSKRNVFIDAVVAVVAAFCALFVRLDGDISSPLFLDMSRHVWQLIIIQIFVFLIFGLYHVTWRYASIFEAMRVLLAVIVTVILCFFWLRIMGHSFPMSFFFLFIFFDFLMIAGTRYWHGIITSAQYRLSKRRSVFDKRVLIVGAGEAGAMLAREIQLQVTERILVVGFVDDDKAKQGKALLGHKVFGGHEELVSIAERERITDIYIAMPSASGSVRRGIAEIARMTGAEVKILPSLFDIAGGRVTYSQLRKIEIEDLLQRDVADVSSITDMVFYTGKRVMITGAGGSIGSEICRQLARVGPEYLVLLGRGENSIYEIERELRRDYQNISIISIVCDVRDEKRMEKLFERYRPNVVFHAAAHKHVPLMEYQADEAYNNNVYGTYVVASLSVKYSCDRFVLVSTDKAVNPTNIMGASKRLAELVVKALAINAKNTKFCAVRFGNVLGSRGSVVPFFRDQIRRGGPITVTHPDMKRYFMTIPEACQLVIKAGTLTNGGEVFLLDMGEPVKITDLALEMIKLSGLIPYKDIDIKYTGLRPGEKLFEELWKDSDANVRTIDEKLFVLLEEDNCRLKDYLATVKRRFKNEEVCEQIYTWVPEYKKT